MLRTVARERSRSPPPAARERTTSRRFDSNRGRTEGRPDPCRIGPARGSSALSAPRRESLADPVAAIHAEGRRLRSHTVNHAYLGPVPLRELVAHGASPPGTSGPALADDAVQVLEDFALDEGNSPLLFHPAFRFLGDLLDRAGVDPVAVSESSLEGRFLLAHTADDGLAVAPLASLGKPRDGTPRVLGYLCSGAAHQLYGGVEVREAAVLRRRPFAPPDGGVWWVYWVDAWLATELGCDFTRRPGTGSRCRAETFITTDHIPAASILRREPCRDTVFGIVGA